MDRGIDILFIFDIFTNFKTMYLDIKSDQYLSDSKKIFLNYVKGRFIVDLIASIPFEFIASFFANAALSSSATNFLSMLKLTRLLRLGRMVSYIQMN